MENFLDNFYELYLEKTNLPFGKPDKNSLDEEWKLYEFLYNNLSAEYKEAFIHYVNLRENQDTEEKRTIYKNGFKDGIHLIIESLQ